MLPYVIQLTQVFPPNVKVYNKRAKIGCHVAHMFYVDKLVISFILKSKILLT